ncbi:MAG: hypothetical protein HY735_00785 [Verrucomicrobia bacterium]|nr:hypothetical protein [Verrucomicrobiota bacterium]
MKPRIHTITESIFLCFLLFGAGPVMGQIYFSEDFDSLDTAGLVKKGWDLGKNEFAKEDGTDFVVAPPYPKAEPGADLTDASGKKLLNPPTADGTESKGKYLLSDSDAAGGSDDIGSKSEFWAITPSFSTVGSGAVWFHADAEYEANNNGECIAELAASVDGGKTWIPVWQTAEPQRPLKGFQKDVDGAARIGGYPLLGSGSQSKSWSGIHGRWHLPLPAEASNKPDVKLRIEFYEPADAWWIALDNIVVDGNAPPQGKEVVLLEQFEKGIPSNWKNTSKKGQKWGTEPLKDASGAYLRQAGGAPVNIDLVREMAARRKAGADLPDEAIYGLNVASFTKYAELANINPNSGTDGRWLMMLAGQNYAMWQEGPDVEEEGNLDTPVLDLATATEVFLDFDSEMLMGNNSSVYEVYVSVDGGGNFSRIFTYNGALTDRTEGSYFMHHYLAVPSAAGKSGVVFRFWAKGGDPDQFEGFWVIDNVRVTATKGATTAPKLNVARQGADLVLSWTGAGALQSADDVTGPWTNVSGAASPLTVKPTTGRKFYRLRQ